MEKPGQNIGLELKGEISGLAEVRDKNGNLKGSFTFSGKGSKATFEEIQKALGKDNGSNSDHSGS